MKTLCPRTLRLAEKAGTDVTKRIERAENTHNKGQTLPNDKTRVEDDDGPSTKCQEQCKELRTSSVAAFWMENVTSSADCWHVQETLRKCSQLQCLSIYGSRVQKYWECWNGFLSTTESLKTLYLYGNPTILLLLAPSIKEVWLFGLKAGDGEDPHLRTFLHANRHIQSLGCSRELPSTDTDTMTELAKGIATNGGIQSLVLSADTFNAQQMQTILHDGLQSNPRIKELTLLRPGDATIPSMCEYLQENRTLLSLRLSDPVSGMDDVKLALTTNTTLQTCEVAFAYNSDDDASIITGAEDTEVDSLDASSASSGMWSLPKVRSGGPLEDNDDCVLNYPSDQDILSDLFNPALELSDLVCW